MTQENKESAVESKVENTNDIVKNFLANQKVSRYGKAIQTQFTGKIDNLMGELGISETSRIDVIAGNTTDKQTIYGLVLANVVLKPKAKEEFNKGLVATEEEESE